MIARLLWWLLLGGIAAGALFAQLDRSARFNPALADMVPTAFSGFAAEQRTRQAIAAQDNDAAIAEASALLQSRPLPAYHLSLFAIAAAMNGEEESSRAAIELAMQRGWRDPMSQQAAAAAAIDQNAHDIAAMRIAALYAIGNQSEFASVFAAQLIANPEGRAAFARRFAREGHWQTQAYGALSDEADSDDFAAAMVVAKSQNAALDCQRLTRIGDRFERGGQESAAQILRDLCSG